ncbi:MAG: ribonuclease E/G [Paracoccaceae bacterium]
MAKKMLIDATHAEETRVVVVDGNKVEEFDFESENKRQLAGNIYLAKVTRVEPSLQAAFIDYGGNRHGFLAFSEIHPDYYQIPVADREALLAEERAFAQEQEEEEEKRSKSSSRSRSRGGRSRSRAENTGTEDAVTSTEAGISGMDVVELEGEDEAPFEEGTSPAFLVHETPVETPASTEELADNDEDTPEPEAQNGDEPADEIESVAEEDVSEEIRQPRKPRPRKYKIQEVVKVRQILLVQVVKEERGNKGAALTTYLSLAGRYCVLMPNTARGGGISRKITNAQDRKKLKEIANEIEVPQGAGLIIRTAGSQRTKTEIKRDYEYLQRLWEQIRELTLKSIAPAKIYEEGDLIKRSIRDLYNKDIDEVFVEGEAGYRTAKDFMKMIMPSHAKNVKYYHEAMPLFARYQVESYLSSMFNPTVQLRSGGYIVIGVTEALVAIDVNSGRATKEGSIEDTATKTNLEAAEEVARQLRLRDLAGLIVIDFIDMEERRNNAAVEKRFKDKLKTDRARIQVGRISGFGLMEMSRQRLRPGMIEATTAPCHHCHGTGLVRSDDNLALNILRQLEEEGVRRRSREVLLKAPVGIVNFLVNNKREHVAQIEARYGMSVRIEADPFLISPDFAIEKFKTATRAVPEAGAAVVSVDASLMQDIDDEVDVEDEDEIEVSPVQSADDETGQPPKKKRRRRRRRKSANGQGGDGRDQEAAESDGRDEPEIVSVAAEPLEAPIAAEAAAEKPARKTPVRTRTSRSKKADAEPEVVVEAEVEPLATEAEASAEQPKKTTRTRKTAAKPKAKVPAKAKAAAGAEQPAEAEAAPVEAAPEKPKPASRAKPKASPKSAKEPAMAESENDKPKKKGWWSLGR